MVFAATDKTEVEADGKTYPTYSTTTEGVFLVDEDGRLQNGAPWNDVRQYCGLTPTELALKGAEVWVKYGEGNLGKASKDA